MVVGRDNGLYIALIVSLIILLLVRFYFRFCYSMCFNEDKFYNDCIYYYIIFLIPLMAILSKKAFKIKYIQVINYLIVILNLLVSVIYFYCLV
ncbi:membrane protein of unknown function [Flavobacterium collinsii]|uniref:Uncharacterized protein n=1 Tax=Flavobacterium collinsii TaxID=1114861 RepID=A0A9W4TDA5_9FLAO|nr:membrane protein of unknown function [Flavobacterium collinsii]